MELKNGKFFPNMMCRIQRSQSEAQQPQLQAFIFSSATKLNLSQKTAAHEGIPKRETKVDPKTENMDT
jgi:hypothetical protein